MDSNLSLQIGFKGQLKLTAQAVPLQEGYLKIGGTVDEADGLKFGVAVSSDPDTPDLLEAGIASGNTLRGICVFDDAIAQNAPAHPDRYLDGMPCAVLNHGFVWLVGWTKEATGAQDPEIGCKVIANNDTGAIEFLASSGSAPSGYTEIENASVRSVDANHGALVYIN